MSKLYNELGFDDDMELMNLTYKMNTGNFVSYNENDNLLNINNNMEIEKTQNRL